MVEIIKMTLNIDEPSRCGDLDFDARWNLLLFVNVCKKKKLYSFDSKEFSLYFLNDFPSRRRRSRLDESQEHFLYLIHCLIDVMMSDMLEIYQMMTMNLKNVF